MLSWARATYIARKHKLKARGIRYPVRTVREARGTGLPLALACAFLEQESGGGHNIFGHDAVASIVGGPVTKSRYDFYKRRRKLGLGMQGVGPMQLTWFEFQDRADREGGCWKPSINMRVGFSLVKGLIRTHGQWEGIKRYNGSGIAASNYANEVSAKYKRWQERFKND